MDIKKILVVKGMGIGDVILGVPLLRNLRKAFPKAHICVLNQQGPGRQMLQKCRYIDELIGAEALTGSVLERAKFVNRLRKMNFDVIIDSFPTTDKTALLCKLIGAKKIIGFANNKYSKLYDIRIEFDRKKNIVDIEEGVLRHLGYKGKYDKKLELFIKPKKFTLKEGISGKQIKNYICISAGKDVDTVRSWPNDRWARLADTLIEQRKTNIIFIGAGTDVNRVKFIQKMMQHTDKSINLVDKISFEQTLFLLKNSKMLICVNGGALHMTAALDVKSVSLDGSSGYFWDAYSKKSVSIRASGLDCMPCESFFCKLPKKDKVLCMRLITEKNVIDAVSKTLK